MTYVEGFVAAVPKANRDAYLKHAADAAKVLLELGVARHVEAWANDVPDGTVTDFRKSVQAKEDEDVVFSWFEYSDAAARRVFMDKMMADPRMAEMSASMPFDGKRMIYGGFQAFVERGSREGGAYVDGFVLPVPEGNDDAYRAMAETAAPIFIDHGALHVVEAWGDDVPTGTVTDFYRAVQAKEGERVVFSWITWLDKATRDAGWANVMEDERMKHDPANNPFDGKRMFWGGFDIIFDTADQSTRTPERELA